MKSTKRSWLEIPIEPPMSWLSIWKQRLSSARSRQSHSIISIAPDRPTRMPFQLKAIDCGYRPEDLPRLENARQARALSLLIINLQRKITLRTAVEAVANSGQRMRGNPVATLARTSPTIGSCARSPLLTLWLLLLCALTGLSPAV